MADIPACPASLKAIQHYLKIAQEHATRDPVVCYWSQLYALQAALNIDRKSDESKAFLVKMMDRLEVLKKQLKENEAITNEIAAQAHIENYALKLFTWADSQDRASNFGKNVVKAFYTSGMLFDVLTTFGELTEEVQQNRKYAKWKAAYIHNCLKNGETPIPGPMKMDEEEDMEGGNAAFGSTGDDNQEGETPGISASMPKPPSPGPSTSVDEFGLPQVPPRLPDQPPAAFNPSYPSQPSVPSAGFGFDLPSTPAVQPFVPPARTDNLSPSPSLPSGGSAWNPSNSVGVSLTPEQMTKAQKYCKFAGSALSYDDVATAMINLEKALHLLKTGVDPN